MLFGYLLHTAAGAAKERWPSVFFELIDGISKSKKSIVGPYFIENKKRIEANN